MNCKRKYLCSVFVLVFTSLCLPYATAVKNADFEQGISSETLDFNFPADWQREYYTAVVDNFVPIPEDGSARDWQIDIQKGLSPHHGDTFFVCSTGNMGRATGYGRIWQEVIFYPGDRLSGFYFFGTCDYMQFNDRGRIYIAPASEPDSEGITIVEKCVDDVGDYNSMSAWERFDYTFDANNAGVYNLYIRVEDYGDAVYESYLAVDGLRVCHDAPENGDINLDCTVNLEDFALLAADWLCDCNDVNTYTSPEHNCIQGSDLNKDSLVDINDLEILSQNWLDGLDQLPDCNQRPEFGDFNYDCTVNFEDFAMFAYDWLCNCSSPEVYLDYNSNCKYQTDVADDWVVDVYDLRVLLDNWLLGNKE